MAGSDGFNPKFTGQMRDIESRLDYFNARYYSPEEGRFLSPDPGNAGADPTNPQTWNGYAYVGSNPLSTTDPSGQGWFGDFVYDIVEGVINGATFGLWGAVQGILNGDPPPPAWSSLNLGGLTGCGGALGNCGTVGGIWEEQGLGQDVQNPSQFVFNFEDSSGVYTIPGLVFFTEGLGVGGRRGACNDTNAVGFAKAHAADAFKVAQSLGVPTSNVLGLSAQESQWGTGRIARDDKNYFSLHANPRKPAPFEIGQQPALKDGPMSVFSSYLASANSFAAQYGALVRGKIDPVEFVRALMPKFNSGDPKTGGDAKFFSVSVGAIRMTGTRLGCR